MTKAFRVVAFPEEAFDSETMGAFYSKNADEVYITPLADGSLESLRRINQENHYRHHPDEPYVPKPDSWYNKSTTYLPAPEESNYCWLVDNGIAVITGVEIDVYPDTYVVHVHLKFLKDYMELVHCECTLPTSDGRNVLFHKGREYVFNYESTVGSQSELVWIGEPCDLARL